MPIKTVTEIAPNPFLQNKSTWSKKVKVAAYCRVSTKEEEQLGSFETQVAAYTEMIENNPKWKLAGIFADKGKTGRQVKSRPGFLEMIEKCKAGKIDLILTKSVSRFARNNKDFSKYMRELKVMGIPIIFEKENIDTSTMDSELILNIYSAFSQGESESISRNISWALKKKYENGEFTFRYKNFLGYIKGVNGEPEIYEDEAKTIRQIYTMFLDGDSYVTIKQKLESAGVLSPGGKPIWRPETIKSILTNEKYMGDVILQKTFTLDFLSGEKRTNNGELPKYYVTDSHPGIVSKEVFARAQEEIARRKSKLPITQKETIKKRGRHSGKYALTERLICSNCGCHYRRVTWSIHGRKEIVWRCINRLEFGTKYCADSPTLKEHEIHKAVMLACNQYIQMQSSGLNVQISEVLKDVSLPTELKGKLTKSQKDLKQKNEEFEKLLSMSVSDECSSEFIDAKLKQVSDQLSKLRKAHSEIEEEIKSISSAQEIDVEKAITEKLNGIDNISEQEFSNTLVKRVVDTVRVGIDKAVTVKFVDGVEIAVLNS